MNSQEAKLVDLVAGENKYGNRYEYIGDRRSHCKLDFFVQLIVN